MAMPKTGEYVINAHDPYGQRMKETTEITDKGFLDALSTGKDLLQLYPNAASFSVDRRVYNSLDKVPSLPTSK